MLFPVVLKPAQIAQGQTGMNKLGAQRRKNNFFHHVPSSIGTHFYGRSLSFFLRAVQWHTGYFIISFFPGKIYLFLFTISIAVMLYLKRDRMHSAFSSHLWSIFFKLSRNLADASVSWFFCSIFSYRKKRLSQKSPDWMILQQPLELLNIYLLKQEAKIFFLFKSKFENEKLCIMLTKIKLKADYPKYLD